MSKLLYKKKTSIKHFKTFFNKIEYLMFQVHLLMVCLLIDNSGRFLREATVLGSDSFIQQFKSKLPIHMLNSVRMKRNIHFSSLVYISGTWMVASAVRVLYAHEMENVLFLFYSHTKLILCHFANILWTNEHMMCTMYM